MIVEPLPEPGSGELDSGRVQVASLRRRVGGFSRHSSQQRRSGLITKYRWSSGTYSLYNPTGELSNLTTVGQVVQVGKASLLVWLLWLD